MEVVSIDGSLSVRGWKKSAPCIESLLDNGYHETSLVDVVCQRHCECTWMKKVFACGGTYPYEWMNSHLRDSWVKCDSYKSHIGWKVKVEQHISEVTNIPNVLKVWKKMWCSNSLMWLLLIHCDGPIQCLRLLGSHISYSLSFLLTPKQNSSSILFLYWPTFFIITVEIIYDISFFFFLSFTAFLQKCNISVKYLRTTNKYKRNISICVCYNRIIWTR